MGLGWRGTLKVEFFEQGMRADVYFDDKVINLQHKKSGFMKDFYADADKAYMMVVDPEVSLKGPDISAGLCH